MTTVTTKGKEILDRLEALKNNKWVKEHKCYYGYYPIEYINNILRDVYSVKDFKDSNEYLDFIFRVRDNMEDKGIIKFSKAGTSFKILI